jgi:hypothetical protein
MSLFVKPGYHWALAMSLEKQGKMEAARDELNAELRLNPTSPVKAELERVEKANGH